MDVWADHGGEVGSDSSDHSWTSGVVSDDSGGHPSSWGDEEPSAWVADQVEYTDAQETSGSSSTPHVDDTVSTDTPSSVSPVDTQISTIDAGSSTGGQTWDEYYAEQAESKGDWSQWDGDQDSYNANWYANHGYAGEAATAAEDSVSSYGDAADNYADADSYTSSSDTSADTSSDTSSVTTSTTEV